MLLESENPTQTYKASCHCGAFAYSVKTTSLDLESTEVVRCNCSICMRNGYLLIYVPNDDVTFTSGQFEDLKVQHPSVLKYQEWVVNQAAELHFRDALGCSLLLPNLRQLVYGTEYPPGIFRRHEHRQCEAVRGCGVGEVEVQGDGWAELYQGDC